MGEKEWKRDSAAEGGLANTPAYKLQISNRLPDIERGRQCAWTISANTNIGNGSEMEFTQACCCQENIRPKSGKPEWQHGGGRGGWRFLCEAKGCPQSAGWSHGGDRQEGSTLENDRLLPQHGSVEICYGGTDGQWIWNWKEIGKEWSSLCVWECVGNNYQSSLSCGEQRSCRRWRSAAQRPVWLWWWGPPPVSSALPQRQSRHWLCFTSPTEPPFLLRPSWVHSAMRNGGTF